MKVHVYGVVCVALNPREKMKFQYLGAKDYTALALNLMLRILKNVKRNAACAGRSLCAERGISKSRKLQCYVGVVSLLAF
jgi:hypothetical protein